MRRLSFVVGVVLFVLAPAPAASQATGTLTGRVTSGTGVALAAAQVFISNSAIGALTNHAGFARDAAQAAELSTLFGQTLAPFEVFEREFTRDLLETGDYRTVSADVSGGDDQVQYYLGGRYSFEDGPLGADSLGNARDHLTRIQTNASMTFLRASCALSSVDPDRIFGISTPQCTGNGNPWGSPFATPRERLQQEQTMDVRHFSASVNGSWEGGPGVSVQTLVGLDQVDEAFDRSTPFGWKVDGVLGIC